MVDNVIQLHQPKPEIPDRAKERRIIERDIATLNDDPISAAWFAGIAARRAGVKITANPHKRAPGSREDNCWRAAWMAEDHNLKDQSRVE